MKKDWFKCPVCGKKLLMIDYDKHIEGVYTMCPKCKREIEVKNDPKELRSQNSGAS